MKVEGAEIVTFSKEREGERRENFTTKRNNFSGKTLSSNVNPIILINLVHTRKGAKLCFLYES